MHTGLATRFSMPEKHNRIKMKNGPRGECLTPTRNTIPRKSQTARTSRCHPPHLTVRLPSKGTWCGRRRMERCGIFPVVNRTPYREKVLRSTLSYTHHVGMVHGGGCGSPDSVDGHPTVPVFTGPSPPYDTRRFLSGGCRGPRASRLSRRRGHGRPRGTSRVRVSHVPGIRRNDAILLTVAAEI